MTLPNFRTPQAWIASVMLLSVVGGSVWAWSRRGDGGVVVPSELSVASLAAQAKSDPGQMMNTVRNTIRRDDLTDEQRKQIGQNIRSVWESAMRERMDQYYAATTDEDRTAILDQQIDEFEQRRKEWEQRRKADEKEEVERADREQRGPGMFGPQSKDERKERSESRNPDQMARQMAYFAAMSKRMGERGIKAPFGPSAGRGGPGRGPTGPSSRPNRGP